jgi:hypothetical protein
MSFFKTRVWYVTFNENVFDKYEDEDVIRKYRYHYMFKFMSDNDFQDFKKNIEYIIDKKTFHKLLKNSKNFSCNIRFDNNSLTPFTIEDTFIYIFTSGGSFQSHLLKSEFKIDKDGFGLIECTWYTPLRNVEKCDIENALESMADGWCGGYYEYLFNKHEIKKILLNIKKNLSEDIIDIISELAADTFLFDSSAVMPTRSRHEEEYSKTISIIPYKPNYEHIMKQTF